MLEEILKQIIAEKEQQGISPPVILNFLKEYIQCLVLSSIYNHKKYQKLVFKGGSCLRVCFDLPRLSEDLDFDYEKKGLAGDELEAYLATEIRTKFFPNLETKKQSTKRIYLKFPLLYNLEMARSPESDKLYVKIETKTKIVPYAQFELTPISKFGFNFIAYHYNLPTLMAGKIHALLYRLWFKGKKQEIDIKGRDFYDLYWFLKNEITPNWNMLKKTTGVANQKELKKILKERVEKMITPQKLAYDLKNFMADPQFVSDFAKNYLKIIGKYLN